MKHYYMILTAICLSTLHVAARPNETILGDFEDGTYQGWTIEGDAFGEAPATGKIG